MSLLCRVFLFAVARMTLASMPCLQEAEEEVCRPREGVRRRHGQLPPGQMLLAPVSVSMSSPIEA